MKALARGQIDALLCAVEADSYGLALASAGIEEAESLLLRAVQAEARSFAGSTVTDLKERLRDRIRLLVEVRSRRRLAGLRPRRPARRALLAAPHQPAVVPPALHARLVDTVEEGQYVEPTARRKTILLSLLGAALVAAVVFVVWTRLDALAGARPTIRSASPSADSKAVPTRGVFRITFDRPPADQPRLHIEPVDGVVGPAVWDGQTLVVSYIALHNDRQYALVLDANYRSRFQDTGHFQTRWTFRTEGYPAVVSTQPANGDALVARNGQLIVNFNHGGDVEPRVTIAPADGTIEPGSWNGASWNLAYRDLKPSTRYQATIVLDFGIANRISRTWSFVTEPASPPAGTPVLWHSQNDPANRGDTVRMLALDWNGNLVGTMYQPVTLQSPDGSIVGTADGTYLERNGARLSELSGIPFFPVIADDDRTVCELSNVVNGRTSDQQWLMFGPLNGPLRPIAPLGTFGARSGFGITACSALSHRAVIVYSAVGGPTAVSVVDLSTGRIVFQHPYTLAVSNVVSSRDGRYLAEQMPVQGSYGAPSSTVIRRTSDGAIVARLANQIVVRFSWDDQRVVASTPYQSSAPNTVTVLAWQTGRVLWTMPAVSDQSQPAIAWAEPNGGKMAIASSSQAAWPLDRLWIVDAEGQAKLVVTEVFYAASVTGF